jgi:hypothetical protein
VSPEPVWVYVAGAGRSGSTLLGVLVAAATGGVNCGELRYLWRLRSEGQPCQCGEELSSCVVWSRVIADVRHRLGSGFDTAVTRAAGPLASRPQWVGRFSRPSELDAVLRAETERAIERVTGAPALVDVSKGMWVLTSAARRRRQLVVVHLVRDPRGVAYSWSRPKRIDASGALLGTYEAWTAARHWTLSNLHLEYALALDIGRLPWVTTMRLTYEDLARDAARTVAAITRVVGHNRSAPHPASGHGLAGNTALYRREPVAVDRRWESEMSRRDKAIVVAMTAPLLWRYGYSLRTTRSAVAAGPPRDVRASRSS